MSDIVSLVGVALRKAALKVITFVNVTFFGYGLHATIHGNKVEKEHTKEIVVENSNNSVLFAIVVVLIMFTVMLLFSCVCAWKVLASGKTPKKPRASV